LWLNALRFLTGQELIKAKFRYRTRAHRFYFLWYTDVISMGHGWTGESVNR
jgi:hypothetical protein